MIKNYMANNKINSRNFFDIGGFCEIDYICVLNGHRERCCPKNWHEYNLIVHNGLAHVISIIFLFEGKGYEPLIENEKGMFNYLKLKY